MNRLSVKHVSRLTGFKRAYHNYSTLFQPKLKGYYNYWPEMETLYPYVKASKKRLNELQKMSILNTDFIEFDNKYEIKMDIPGLKKDDLSINVDSGMNIIYILFYINTCIQIEIVSILCLKILEISDITLDVFS